MVKIKRFISDPQLSTNVPALQSGSEFTGVSKALEKASVAVQNQAVAMQAVNAFNQNTKARVRYATRVFEREQLSLDDPEHATNAERAMVDMQRFMDEEAATIDDPEQRNKFTLTATTQRLEAGRRISNKADTKLVREQKNDYEVFMDVSTEKIHEYRFLDPDSIAANDLAAEVVKMTAEMEGTGVIFPDVATERLNTFKVAIQEGQATYDLDHANTQDQFDLIRARFESDFYGLGQTENEKRLKLLDSFEKRKAQDALDAQELGYLENFRDVLDRMTPEGEQIPTTRAEILNRAANGEGKLEGGIPPESAQVLIAIIDNGDKTQKEIIDRFDDIQTFAANTRLTTQYYDLNISDNANKTGANLEKARIDDQPLGEIKKFIAQVVTDLDNDEIPLSDATKYINMVMKEFSFKSDVQARDHRDAKRAAFTTYKQFMGINIPFTGVTDETAQQKAINNIRSEMVNEFFGEMEKSAKTEEVQGILTKLKEAYASKTNPSIINVLGTPNGVGSKGKSVTEIFDEKSDVKPDLKLKASEVNFRDGTDADGNRFRYFFNREGQAIRAVPIK